MVKLNGLVEPLLYQRPDCFRLLSLREPAASAAACVMAAMNPENVMARRSAPWPSSWITTPGGARLVMTNTCSLAAPTSVLRLPPTGKKQGSRGSRVAFGFCRCSVPRGKQYTDASLVLFRARLAAWCWRPCIRQWWRVRASGSDPVLEEYSSSFTLRAVAVRPHTKP